MTLRDHHISVRRSARYVTLETGDPVDEIWFVLHGYSQLARHFIRWFEPALRPGRLIVAPEALSRAYFDGTEGAPRRVGASWMTKEDREAEITDYVHYLDQVADEVIAHRHGIRLEVHGFSQGGAAAARWAALGSHPVDRLVFWGSTLPPDLDLDRLRAGLRSLPVVIAMGDRDAYIAQNEVQAELARLRGREFPVRFVPFAGGHKVDRDTLVALATGPAPAV